MDPIVASFCGGGVGVLTALLIVELNNSKMQVGRLRWVARWCGGGGGRMRGVRLAQNKVQVGCAGRAGHRLEYQAAAGGPRHPAAPRLLQEKRRCIYCEGSGYLTCGNCVGTGVSGGEGAMCANCAGTGKVMCTSCLCTGKKLATEHDPRVDPFTLVSQSTSQQASRQGRQAGRQCWQDQGLAVWLGAYC